MRFYKFPKWQQWCYPNAIFDFYKHNYSLQNNVIYLTFDDGPTPHTTIQILDVLDAFNAKATFFCEGEKVKNYPELYQEIIKRGHSVGNHSMTHLNGFKTSSKKYVNDILEAKKHINSNLFRPPFGKCTPKQHKKINAIGFTTVFWSHLTYDFDNVLSDNYLYEKCIKATKNGSVIVFHDSVDFNKKWFKRILQHYTEHNFKLVSIEMNTK